MKKDNELNLLIINDLVIDTVQKQFVLHRSDDSLFYLHLE